MKAVGPSPSLGSTGAPVHATATPAAAGVPVNVADTAATGSSDEIQQALNDADRAREQVQVVKTKLRQARLAVKKAKN